MTNTYNVIVIGAGPGGYVAAIRASQLGLKTAIIDKEWLGGVCLNVGCIPSKSLLKNADVAHTLRKRGREFGFSFENLTLDYGKAVKRSRRVSQRLTKGVSFLMDKNAIDVHMGTAQLEDSKTILVTDEDGEKQRLKGENIIIATGARPITIPGLEADGEKILTYHEAILQEKLPQSVVIIGSGAIGVEFATIWSAYGVDVTIVEMLPRLVPLEDADISAELKKNFRRRKINTLTSHRVEDVQKTDHGVQVRVSSKRGEKIIEAEQTLMAIGFRPNTQGLGLEEAGVKLTEQGAIAIDEKMATNLPGVWAIGDVTAKLMLAHVASAQGLICAETIAGLETTPLDYQAMPRATYCHPQIASFGLTAAQAKEKGINVKESQFPFRANGKALGLGESDGWVKILTAPENGKILGAHMVGPEVTELLPELTLAHQLQADPSEIARNVHAHPTLSEVIMEAAHEATGHAIHK
ncbi:MAG: Dihydrolipoyl dehydrogenase [Chloroflexi bacterium]|nr:Dihydrolipoyl dehydrogenase [Chloroflexota bacterium]